MSKPHSGKYLGTFVFENTDSAAQVTVNLRVHRDGGLTGDFTVVPPQGVKWAGPTSGTFNEGGYSAFGTLHLEEEEQHTESGDATFDGRFEVPHESVCIIWGTVLIRKDDLTQSGTLALVYAVEPETVSTGGPPGVFPDRVWDP